MVLAPLDAISLASAVVQFVQFTSTLISKGNEYHRSANGALVEHDELEAAATNLQALDQSLKQSLAPFSVKRGEPPPELSTEEKALQDTVKLCDAVASEFAVALNGLKVSGKNTKYNSFRQAFMAMWKKDKLEEMVQKLSLAREQLTVNLLVVLSVRSSTEFESLNSKLEGLESKLLLAFRQTTSNIQPALSELGRQLLQASEQTQGHIKMTWQADHEYLISQLSGQLSEVTAEEKEMSVQVKLLDSLYFVQIEERYAKIRERHPQTYRWIFDERPSDMPPWTDLVTWLEGDITGSKLYWVAGKAGSGKSCLMRFLNDNIRTKQHLQIWARGKRLLSAKAFFWNPGTEIQKSQNGLLRSLLHQLLQQSPEFSEMVAPWRWRSYHLGVDVLEPWTDSELIQGLQQFIQASEDTTRICFFIDGLDEFRGTNETRQDLIMMLRTTSEYQNAKVCVSSRPWNIFEDSFGKGPKLLLEDLTRNDIRDYVKTELGKHQRFCTLQLHDGIRCSQLVNDIVGRAQGVFLWIVLVVKSLAEGLRDEDGLSHLFQRLGHIPSDLEEYFKQILLTIDPFYLPDASQLFQVALDAQGSLPLSTLSLIHEDDPQAAVKRLRTDPDKELSSIHHSMKRRINALCKGLLEVHHSDAIPNRLVFSHQVDFLHRTVRDFLVRDEIRALLENYSHGHFDTPKSLCRAFLLQMTSMYYHTGPSNWGLASRKNDFWELLDGFLVYAAVLGPGDQGTLDEFLNELDEVIQYFVSYDASAILPFRSICSDKIQTFKPDVFANWSRDQNTLLSFLIETRLIFLAKSRLKANPAIVRQKKGRPLLDFALGTSTADFGTKDILPRYGTPDVELVTLLLKQGVDPNEKHAGSTPWRWFLEHLLSFRFGDDRNRQQCYFELTKLLIQHGASTSLQGLDSIFRKAFTVRQAEELELLVSPKKSRREKSNSKADTAKADTAKADTAKASPRVHMSLKSKFKGIFS